MDTKTAETTSLLQFLDRLKALALAEGFDIVLDEAEDLREKLVSNRFEVVVMGQFKRGKSSLINALVGVDVLPVGSVPLTSVMTVVRYSPKPEARVLFRKREPVAVSLEQLPLFTTEKGNPRNHKGVLRVEVGLDAPILAEGDVLIDTPGVGSTHIHNSRAAHEILPRADAVLYVLSVDPPIGEEDLKFLVSIRQHASKVVFVLNKRDYLAEKEFEENLAFTEQVLKDTLQVDSVALFPLSARWALEGRERNAGFFEKSGIAALETYLQEFLRQGKGRHVLERVAVRAEEAARSALALVELEHRAYLSNGLELETKAFSLSSAINYVFMEGGRATRRLKAALTELQLNARSAARSFGHLAAKPLAREMAGAIVGSAHLSSSDLTTSLSRFYSNRGKKVLSDFFREKDIWLAHGFEKVRSEYEGRILHLLGGVWKTAGELLGGLPSVDTRPPEAIRVSVPFFKPRLKFSKKLVKGFSAKPGKKGAKPKPGPSKIRRLQKEVESNLVGSAVAGVDQFIETCRAAMAESISDLDRLSRQAHELADRAVKVAVQRQGANEAEVAGKLAVIRQTLTTAQGLFNDISKLHKQLQRKTSDA